MSGHSKWHSIRHKKGIIDAKRGKIFTKLAREITIAAKMGGGDPDANPRLRTAIQKAKENNMPSENIKRAIQKGTGELPGVVYEEMTYEGYGPGGVAILLEVATDNKNRTVSEIRNIFSKKDGNLASSGSVSYLFNTKGYFVFDKDKIDEEKLLEFAMEAGAEDFKDEGSTIEVFTSPKDFEKVKEAFVKNGISFEQAEITKIPTTYVKVEDEKTASKLLSLIDALQDHDDVQHLYSNFDIDEDMLNKLSG